MCKLRSSFSRVLSKIVPEAVFVVDVDLGHFLHHSGSSIELGPLLLRIGILERITHFGNTISTVTNIKRCVVLLEMLW